MGEAIEMQRKQQEEKIIKIAEEQYQKRKDTENKDGYKIMVGLLVFVLVAGYLQYKSQVHQRYSNFRVGNEEDLYKTLESDSGLSDQ